MVRNQDTIWCNGCGAEILWAPLIVEGQDYCCQDCREGRPCRCGERMEPDEDRRACPAQASSAIVTTGANTD